MTLNTYKHYDTLLLYSAYKTLGVLCSKKNFFFIYNNLHLFNHQTHY